MNNCRNWKKCITFHFFIFSHNSTFRIRIFLSVTWAEFCPISLPKFNLKFNLKFHQLMSISTIFSLLCSAFSFLVKLFYSHFNVCTFHFKCYFSTCPHIQFHANIWINHSNHHLCKKKKWKKKTFLSFDMLPFAKQILTPSTLLHDLFYRYHLTKSTFILEHFMGLVQTAFTGRVCAAGAKPHVGTWKGYKCPDGWKTQKSHY